MAIERTIRYSGKDITILWKPHLCIHSTKCWKSLPGVFKPQQRPWVDPDGSDADTTRAQVLQCPSGALSLPPEEARMDEIAAPNTVVDVQANGPLLVKGDVEVRHPDGRVEVKERQCALCRCGASGNKPFCDGSHKRVGFAG